MNIPLKKSHADWIAEQISSGRYGSELEAIEDAIAAMMRDDEADFVARRDELRAKIRRTEEDLKHGRVVVADDAFWDDIFGRIDKVEAARRS